MADYRVYCLSADGHIISGDYICASDDEEAVVLVRGKAEKTDCDIWLGTRRVAMVLAGGEVPKYPIRA